MKEVKGIYSYSELPAGYLATNQEEKADIERYERIQMLPWRCWCHKSIKLPMTIYILSIHILSVVGILNCMNCKSATLVWSGILWFLSGLGITAGAHRLWTHRSYKAIFSYRFVMMIFTSIANQGSIYHWVRDHRIHHLYSETKADPHNALRGFVFAHIGWLLVKKDPRIIFAGRKLDLSDIDALPEVIIQRTFQPFWNGFWCFGFATLVPMILWGEPMYRSFLVAGVLRYTITLHCTWLVNSAAHLYGIRPYSDINPAENPVVSLLAGGEGWHNYHHTYPFDYSTSELGVLNQWNPTKAVIDVCALLGVTWDRRRALKHWEARKKKLGITHDSFTSLPFLTVRNLKA